MCAKKKIDRRNFIGKVAGTATAATAFSIVPRSVLGKGFVPPSDRIVVANIGCGTQGLREMPELLQNPHIQVVAVCDVNKYSTDYLDWSPNGLLNGLRRALGNQDWGTFIKGIPGGRDFAQRFVEEYYAKHKTDGSYKGIRAYEDYRELLEKETDIDAVKIMTPDHHHGWMALEAIKKGKMVITHKPIANRLAEGRMVIEAAKKYAVKTHLLAWMDKPNYRLIKQWIDEGVIGDLKAIHNWSFRPVWPQYMGKPKDSRPIPEGFNWDLWLGPEKDRPFHPNYTHNVFRGWYDFGGGSIADMGHYSLFPLFEILGVKTAPVSAKAYGTVYRTVENQVCRGINNDAAFPYSSTYKFRFPKQAQLPAFDLFWYDGGIKPFAPEELEVDGRDIPAEGLLFEGTAGKIMAGFQGRNPEILPKKRMAAYTGNKTAETASPENRTETWVNVLKEGKESPGSFLNAGPITDMINLGAAALRAGNRIDFDTTTGRITNDEEANKFLNRDYRPGWEMKL